MPLSPVPGCNRVFILLFVLALSLLFPAGRPAAQTSGAFVTVSAASYAAPVAPDSIVAGFGSGLAAETVLATDADQQTPGIQLPTTLGGTTVEVNGVKAGLFFVSPQQINYLIPAGTAAGTASVTVKRGEMTAAMGTVQVAATAPALFAANSDGQGVPAGYVVRVKPDASQSTEAIEQFNATQQRLTARPIPLGPEGDVVVLVLFGGGVRRATAGEAVRALIDGVEAQTFFAAHPDFVGLDQVNVVLPRTLLGRGYHRLKVSVGERMSNELEFELALPDGSTPMPTATFDSIILDEDTTRMFRLSGSDPEGRPLFFTITSQPQQGSLSGSGAEREYLPAANYNGVDALTFKVNNGLSDSATATVTLLIRSVNDPPSLMLPGPQRVEAGESLRLTVSATDPDAGNVLNLAVTGLPEGASFAKTNATNYDLRWIPLATQSGSYALNFKLEDNGSPVSSDTKSMTITVGAQFAKASGLEGGQVDVVFLNGGNVYAGAASGVYVSESEGRSWADISNEIERNPINTFVVTEAGLFAGGTSNLFRSINGGQSWTIVTSGFPAPGTISCRTFLQSGSTLFLGTSGGGIYRSTNGGLDWASVSDSLKDTRVNALAINESGFFAGTQGEGIFRSTDGGLNWAPASTGLTNLDVRSLIVSEVGLLAGTIGGGIFRSSNGGQSWILSNTGLPPESRIISLVRSGSNIFAGNFTGGVFRSGDGGQSWIPADAGLGTNLIFSLDANEAALVAGTSNGVYRSADNGQSWARVNTGLTLRDVRALAMSGQDVLAGTLNAGIYRSTDGGQTWSLSNTGFPSGSLSVYSFAVKGTDIFSAVLGLGVYRSTDSGRSWTPARGGLPRTFDATVNSLIVYGNSLFAGTGIVSGGAGVFVSTNNGQNWTPVNTGLTNLNVRALAFSGDTLFAGTAGGVFRSTDGGLNWMASSTGLTNLDIRAIAVKGTTLFAGTGSLAGTPPESVTLFRSTDGGLSWEPANAGVPSTLVNSLIVSGSHLFAGLAGRGNFFRSTDDGQSWVRIEAGLRGVSVAALTVSGTALLAGTGNGGVFSLTTQGQSWAPLNTGLTNRFVNAVASVGSNLYASTLGSGVFRSADQGQTWSSANVGLPPITNAQSVVVSSNGERVFAGTFGEGVFSSTDEGMNWSEVNSGLTNKFVNAVAISDSTVLAATDGGGVFRSTDDGQTWSPANNGLANRFVLTLAVSDSKVFAGTDGGGVFISTDDGQTWSASNTGLTALDVRSFGFSGNAIFAGTLSRGIFRSTDGAQSWVPVNNELPRNFSVFSFAVSGVRVYAGTIYGVFVSSDQGENWKQVNAGMLDIFVTSLALNGENLFAGTLSGGVFISQIPR